MGTIIFGHGGLDPMAAGDMEWSALPAGTTLQFYADAGQVLLTGQQTWADFAKTLDAPWDPIDSSGVTYNFRLGPLSDQEQHEIDVLSKDFPHTVLIVGKDLKGSPQLCTGDRTTCPSDPRMVAGTVEGPRTHGCDGILKHYAGEELHWIACTAIGGFDAEAMAAVETAQGDAPSGVLHGQDPDDAVANALQYLEYSPDAFPGWFDGLPQREQDVLLRDPGIAAWSQGRTFATTEWAPSDADLQAVADVNQPYVKELGKEDEGTWEIGGFLVLLGSGHGYTDWVRGQGDYASGTFAVKRATFGAGSLVFYGVPPMHQATVTAAVERFSEKDVEFE
jgi:hypothetical protein